MSLKQTKTPLTASQWSQLASILVLEGNVLCNQTTTRQPMNVPKIGFCSGALLLLSTWTVPNKA